MGLSRGAAVQIANSAAWTPYETLQFHHRAEKSKKASLHSVDAWQRLGLMFSNPHTKTQESPTPSTKPRFGTTTFFLRFLHHTPIPFVVPRYYHNF